MRRESSTGAAYWFTSIALFLLLTTSGQAAVPRTKILHNFVGGSDGEFPSASLVADAAGNLYGTTANGGVTTTCLGSKVGCGTVFELLAPKSPGGTWKEVILYRFTGESDGATPDASLIFDNAGNLYGTTTNGGTFDGVCGDSQIDFGCGVVFELSPNANGPWTETVIHAFTGEYGDGANPVANLVLDSLGNLYGTTELAGSCPSTCGYIDGYGVAFELSPNGSGGWTETILHQFNDGPEGSAPLAGLTFDQSGNLYGVTSSGGTSELGAVFELTPPIVQGQQWTLSVLYAFTSGGGSRGNLIFDKAGNIYGTGANGNGTVFELSPSGGGTWSESTLYEFGQGHAIEPWAGLISDKAGNLYGTTEGKFCGAVFRLQPSQGSWSEAELDFFAGQNEPCNLAASLIFGKWGAAYGTSVAGGKCSIKNGCGTVFGILP